MRIFCRAFSHKGRLCGRLTPAVRCLANDLVPQSRCQISDGHAVCDFCNLACCAAAVMLTS